MFFFFKQKTAYEITRRDWSSDVCSSDLSRSDVETNVGECSIRSTAFGLLAARQIGRRRVGKECALLCRSRWSPYHKKKKYESSSYKTSESISRPMIRFVTSAN